VLVKEELTKQVTVLPHPPYSSDFTPHDFIFLSPLERKAMLALISAGQDHHCHKESLTGPSCKYLSAVLPEAIPMLADIHSCLWQLY
jgi:hypothetical protein